MYNTTVGMNLEWSAGDQSEAHRPVEAGQQGGSAQHRHRGAAQAPAAARETRSRRSLHLHDRPLEPTNLTYLYILQF